MKVVNNAQVQITQNSSGGLHDGSTVRGRVISAGKNGVYTISLAGQTINVTSKVPLEIGSVFQAKLQVVDNKILLQLLNLSSTDTRVMKFFPEDLQKSPPPQALQDYLSSLGLPVEGDSLRLLQFMRENGVKFDFEKLRKIFSRNANSKDKSKNDRLQSSIILEEKGIDSQMQIVDGVLYNNSENNSEEKNEDDDDKDRGVQFRSFLDDVKNAAVSNKFGPLTFFNTFSEGDNHWFIIPFEWSYNNSTGDIRVFYNRRFKSPSKIVINCATDLKKYIFKLKLSNSNVSSVEIALEPPLNLEKQQSFLFELKEKLQKLCDSNNSIVVEIADYNTLQGFAPENEPLTVLRETV